MLGFLLHGPKARLSEPSTLFFLERLQQALPKKATVTVSTPALNINYLLFRTNQKLLSLKYLGHVSLRIQTKECFIYLGICQQILYEHSLHSLPGN